MRILVVTQYFWPESFRINELVRDLVSEGNQVTVFTGEPNYPDGRIYKDYCFNPSVYSHYEGAEIIRCRLRPRKAGSVNLVLNYLSFMFSGSFSILKNLRKREFDVVFVFQLSPITLAVPAVLYKMITKTPIVMWVQDLWPESLSATGVIKNRRALSFIGKFVSLVYSRCDLILCQSKAFVENINLYNKKNRPVKYLPNWADGVFSDSKELKEVQYPYKHGSFDIIFAGNFGDAQDLDSILDAFELIKKSNVRLIMLGTGRKHDWVTDQVRSRGLSSSVLLLGHFDLNLMPAFFSHADALLVSLAKSEIFALTIPSKVQAYMASGKPILGMLDGIGAETIVEADCGLVCSAGNSAGLARNALDLASKDEDFLQKIGLSGKHYCENNFNKDFLRDKLLSYFDDVIKENI